MYGDKWWGYLHDNGVVTISPQDPKLYHTQRMSRLALDGGRSYQNGVFKAVVKVVGPFAEDLADDFEGDQKMVRRKIMAAIHERPLEELSRE